MDGVMDGADEIRATAAAVRREADDIGRAADRVRAVSRLRWQSRAADLFRVRVTERARSLDDIRQRLHDVAGDLDRAAADAAALAADGDRS